MTDTAVRGESSAPFYLASAVSCLMLIWAFNPDNPYGYYILLRIVVCATLAKMCIKAFDEFRSPGWGWPLGIGAFIYNPIWRFGLGRETWETVNFWTIIAIVAFVVFAKRKRKKVVS